MGLAGFAHIIAGPVNAFYSILSGKASIGMFCFKFFFPALAGNIIGGVGFVSAINYAQVHVSKIDGSAFGVDD